MERCTGAYSPQALYEYLKGRISGEMSLSEMIDEFQQMCLIPSDAEEEMKLFETGVFPFTGRPLFYFSLTRQLPSGDGEYYQLQLSARYAPTLANRFLFNCAWDERIKGDFFEHVRKSRAFRSMKNAAILERSVTLEQT